MDGRYGSVPSAAARSKCLCNLTESLRRRRLQPSAISGHLLIVQWPLKSCGLAFFGPQAAFSGQTEGARAFFTAQSSAKSATSSQPG
jgi:hypothetical protein